MKTASGFARSVVMAVALAGLFVTTPSYAQDCISNLHIVLDRSCSMTQNSIMGKTRWAIAVDAINNLTTKQAGKLRFGLGMFPDKGVVAPKCVQTTAHLSPGPGNEQAVRTLLASNTPGSPCVTNIDEGIKQAAADPALYGTDRRSFVVLITDGAQSSNCNGGRATADPLTVQYLTELYNKKVPTYVVGFDVGTNATAQASLNSFATAGGLPNTSGTLKFYAANNQAELEATLDKLAGIASSGDVSFCQGVPCPDGRCLTATAQCVSGFCVEPPPPSDTGGGGGPDGTGGAISTNGCACQLGAHSQAGTAGLTAPLFFAAALIWRLRRRRQLAN